MEKYLQRLQTLFQKLDILPREVRDGMIAAYVVVSCLHQQQGNPGTGLGNEAEGINNHIQGFASAVFWERGFDFNNPTLEQLTEVKIMVDGIAQTYAMSEELQTALNEIIDCLMKRSRNEKLELSAATQALLHLAVENFSELPAAVPAEEEPLIPIDVSSFEVSANPDTVAETSNANWENELAVEIAAMNTLAAVESAATAAVMPELTAVPLLGQEPDWENFVIPESMAEETVMAAPEMPAAEDSDSEKLVWKISDSEQKTDGEDEPPELPTSKFEPALENISKLVSEIEQPVVLADLSDLPSSSNFQDPAIAPMESAMAVQATPESSAPEPEPEYQLNWKADEIIIPFERPVISGKMGETGSEVLSFSVSSDQPRSVPIPPKQRQVRKKQEIKESIAPMEVMEKKKRGRKKKVDAAGMPIKTKRIRRINATEVKINLANIEVPADYMMGGESAAKYNQAADPVGQISEIPLESPRVPIQEIELPAMAGEYEMPNFTMPEDEARFDLSKLMESSAQPIESTSVTSGAPAEEFFSFQELAPMPTEQLTPATAIQSGETPDTAMEGSDLKMSPIPEDEREDIFGEMPKIPKSQSNESIEPTRESRPFSNVDQPLVSWDDFEPKVKEEQWTSVESPEAPTEEPSQAVPSRTFSFSEQLEKSPEPESSPSSWTELKPESPALEPKKAADLHREGIDVLANGPGDHPPRPPQISFARVIIAGMVGLILGLGLCFTWFSIFESKKTKGVIASLQEQVIVANRNMENTKQELESAQQQVKEMTRRMEQLREAAKQVPMKPKYIKVGNNALIYWMETKAVRKYYVYKAKTKTGKFERVNQKPQDENLLLVKAGKGSWQYAISALDMDNQETGQSDALEIKFPLKK